MKLILDATGEPIEVGKSYLLKNGHSVTVSSIQKPHKPASTGRVHTDGGSFFPGVLGASWVEREDHEHMAPLVILKQFTVVLRGEASEECHTFHVSAIDSGEAVEAASRETFDNTMDTMDMLGFSICAVFAGTHTDLD